MQFGERPGGMPGEAPLEQAGGGAGESAADDGDPTVQPGDRPGGMGEGDSDSSGTEGGEDEGGSGDEDAEDIEDQRSRLEAATKQRADEAAGMGRRQRGPCLSGVMDTRTGEMFFGRNTFIPLENIHPALRSRLTAYLERTGGVTPERAGNLTPEFGGGAHSEINALNDAFQAREQAGLGPVTEAQFNEFLIHNINLGGTSRFGSPMPRCANCFNLTQGVQVTPSVHAAEVEFYNEEYGPGFMDDVTQGFQRPQGQGGD